MTASKATAASELEAMPLPRLATQYRMAVHADRMDDAEAVLAELRRREERERKLREASGNARNAILAYAKCNGWLELSDGIIEAHELLSIALAAYKE